MDGKDILLTLLLVLVFFAVLAGVFWGGIFLGEFVFQFVGANFGTLAQLTLTAGVWVLAAGLLVWIGFHDESGAVTYLACLFLIGVFEFFFSGTPEGNLVCVAVPILLGLVVWLFKGHPLLVAVVSAGMCVYLLFRFANTPQAQQVTGGAFALLAVLLPPAVYFKFVASNP